MKNKVKVLIISITLITLVIIAGTFAWLRYQSNKTAMVLTIGDINNVQVTLYPYQINETIAPTTSYNSAGNSVVNVTATNNTSVKKRVSLYYDINEIDEDLATEDFKYTITRKTTQNGSFSQLKTGDFDEAVAGQPYEILNEKIPETATYEYKVYLWLDGTQTENTEGASFSGELRADISFENKMKASTSTSLSKVFDSGISRGLIETVTFLNQIPGNITSADQPQDVSVDGNGDVIAYFKDEDGNSKYEMYIAADGKIVPINLVDFFTNFGNLTEVNNLNYLDYTEVTRLDYMFWSCNNLTSLDFSNIYLPNVTSISSTFGDCDTLTTVNLSNIEAPQLTTMSAVFENDSALVTVDFHGFNAPNLTIMSGLFVNCNNLTTVDLSGVDTSKVTKMDMMFYVNSSLHTIYVSDSWNTALVTDSYYMFYNAEELPNYDASVIDKTNAHYGSGGYLTYKAYP